MNNIISQEVNKKILNLWSNNYDNDSDALMPLLYHTIYTDSILFIGLNPSWNVSHIRKRLQNIDKDFGILTDNEITEYFKWKNRSSDRFDKAKLEHKEAEKNYSYFTKFQTITDDINEKFQCDEKWQHIDLFYNRITNQNELSNIVYFDSNKNILNNFGKAQLDITYNLIFQINPKIIVIQNVLACNLFNEYFFSINGYVRDTYKGYHTIELNGRKVPVFMSGMFSGQRALDRYTYDRLVWHIIRAYNDYYI